MELSYNLVKLGKGAIDVHCHGVGRFDFSDLSSISLDEIEACLSLRGHKVILTLYVMALECDALCDFLRTFDKGRKKGLYRHILGIALEGPLLSSHGGTPGETVWVPSKRDWRSLAECGKYGLTYIIFSPDAVFDPLGSQALDQPATSAEWIAETLLDGGVLPAAGHFMKNDPVASANALQSIYNVVTAWGQGPTLTDHLYNDMPLNFKHAWRSSAERLHRNVDLKKLNVASWNLSNLEEKLGPVPATMIRNARRGVIKIAQNFDGEHVDLEIVKKTVELTGAENMLMMTDSIESRRLAGRDLTQQEGSSLLYQNEGIVAAGSQSILRQIENMLKIGLSEQQIRHIICDVPLEVFSKREDFLHGKNQVMGL